MTLTTEQITTLQRAMREATVLEDKGFSAKDAGMEGHGRGLAEGLRKATAIIQGISEAEADLLLEGDE